MKENEKIICASYSVKGLSAFLGIGLNSAYALVKQPGFPAIRISARRIIVPGFALQKWLEENALPTNRG